MEEALKLLWHIPTVMVTLLVAGLLMGRRHVGELSVFDLLTGIAIGAVAGAGIVDPDLPHGPVLLSILGLAVFHYGITWLIMKWKAFGRLITFDPVVVVKQGRPILSAMRRIRITLSDLLPLLREKDVFDLREVEYGVIEPDGKVTVIKSKNPVPRTGLARAVIVDGGLERQMLGSLGWDEVRLHQELVKQGFSGVKDVLVATLDEAGALYVVPKSGKEEPPVRH